ncbi:MAG: hypothetical protein MI922_18265, partial [Bacteroidales bacterium]|nr:hypothetical protein [Bacteroidales bacterium]
YMGALSLNYRVNDNTLLTLRASAFNSYENIAYDILGEYSINVATGNGGVKRDSLVNIGIGGNLNHGRFDLQSEIYAAEHQGLWNRNNVKLKWGAKWQVEQVSEYANQWTFFDSAGYALPYVSSELQMKDPVTIDYELFRHRITAFLQSTFSFSSNNSDYMLTLGIRGHYSDLEENMFFAPRGNIIAKPHWAPRLSFHLASGIYHQPSFYKELRDYKGKFYKGSTQRSTHYVLGMDFNFRTWNRPFTFTAEAYYKNLDNIIPYKIDDVQVIYMPNFKAKGYATGIDFKVYGEFVPGLESWFSLSILETKEDIYNDEHIGNDKVVHRPGFYSRPSDQLINMAVFFQDYFPLNPKYKVHLTMNITSGLPYTGPSYEIPSETFPLGPYKRVDIGFSRSIKRDKKRNIGLHDIWLSVEVLNLFDVNNKVSYDWIQTVENNEGIANVFSVPNNLTRRRFNVKISASL